MTAIAPKSQFTRPSRAYAAGGYRRRDEDASRRVKARLHFDPTRTTDGGPSPIPTTQDPPAHSLAEGWSTPSAVAVGSAFWLKRACLRAGRWIGRRRGREPSEAIPCGGRAGARVRPSGVRAARATRPGDALAGHAEPLATCSSVAAWSRRGRSEARSPRACGPRSARARPQLGEPQPLGDGVLGPLRVLVLDQVGELEVAASPTGVSSETGSSSSCLQLDDALQRGSSLLGGELLRRRLAAQLLREARSRAVQLLAPCRRRARAGGSCGPGRRSRGRSTGGSTTSRTSRA